MFAHSHYVPQSCCMQLRQAVCCMLSGRVFGRIRDTPGATCCTSAEAIAIHNPAAAVAVGNGSSDSVIDGSRCGIVFGIPRTMQIQSAVCMCISCHMYTLHGCITRAPGAINWNAMAGCMRGCVTQHQNVQVGGQDNPGQQVEEVVQDQAASVGKSTACGLYVGLRLDGRVRASGERMPSWSLFGS